MSSALAKTRWIVLALVTISIAVFVLQNSATVELRLFHWVFETRRSVIVGISLGAGAILGWLFGATRR